MVVVFHCASLPEWQWKLTQFMKSTPTTTGVDIASPDARSVVNSQVRVGPAGCVRWSNCTGWCSVMRTCRKQQGLNYSQQQSSGRMKGCDTTWSQHTALRDNAVGVQSARSGDHGPLQRPIIRAARISIRKLRESTCKHSRARPRTACDCVLDRTCDRSLKSESAVARKHPLSVCRQASEVRCSNLPPLPALPPPLPHPRLEPAACVSQRACPLLSLSVAEPCVSR